jgi:ADP-ribosylglycohydrolase
MIGAIAGDIVGSLYEHRAPPTSFPLFREASCFTDDSVLTVATAESLLSGEPYDRSYRKWGRRYPFAGYGGSFRRWLREDDAGPYGSWGNGSAMRVSPVAFAFDSVERVLEEAERSAAVTHDHPEGIKGAQAAALAVFMARRKVPKEEIRRELATRFAYDMDRTIEQIRPNYRFDVSCQGSVPEALIAFLETTTFEDAVRASISLGGDADTQAAIAGAAAVADERGLNPEIRTQVLRRLPMDMREVLEAFETKHGL